MTLEQIHEEIRGRMQELTPLIEEARELEAVLEAWDSVGLTQSEKPIQKTSGGSSGGRSPRTGKYDTKVVQFLATKGEAGTMEIAKAMGCSSSSATRLLQRLALPAQGAKVQKVEGLWRARKE